MKRTVLLLTLTLTALALAPSAFACWKCDTVQGCYGTDVGVPGRTNCDFDGTCHVSGFCQGFTDEAPLAASYTVAAVHVVDVKAEKALDAMTKVPQPEPQKIEKVAEVTR